MHTGQTVEMASLLETRARACLWDGGLFGIGPGYGAPGIHAHHAHQLTISVAGGPLRFRTSPGEEWRTFRAALVPADQPHAFDGSGALVAMIFIDPETHEGRWLARSTAGGIAAIPGDRIDPHVAGLSSLLAEPFDGQRAKERVEAVVRAACVGPRPHRTPDSRIQKALEHIRRADAAKLSLEEVARTVYLSPSRFAHLFRDELGLPFRRFLLWRRLNRAMLLIGEGRSFTAAAYEAGFADSAHLTRTFQQMFGLAPSAMVGPVDFYEMPTPFAPPAA